MKKIFFSISLSITAGLAFAQQDPQFTQNMFMKLPVNPGYAGTSGSLCATSAYRTQWVGFTGAPQTLFFSADMPVINLHGGLGLTVMTDRLGNFNFTHSRGAYSYHMPIKGGIGLLGIGLELGILQASVADNWLFPQTPENFSNANDITYDAGLGVYYTTKKLHAGISVSHLPAQNLRDQWLNYEAARHYYIMTGYTFDLAPKIKLLPSVHIKSDVAVTTFDLNCNLLYNENIWCGFSYRLQDAIAPMAGIALKPNGQKGLSTLKIGYSYDIGTSGLKPHHSNTHEVLVSYCIKWDRVFPPSSHIFPRNMTGKQ